MLEVGRTGKCLSNEWLNNEKFMNKHKKVIMIIAEFHSDLQVTLCYKNTLKQETVIRKAVHQDSSHPLFILKKKSCNTRYYYFQYWLIYNKQICQYFLSVFSTTKKSDHRRKTS